MYLLYVNAKFVINHKIKLVNHYVSELKVLNEHENGDFPPKPSKGDIHPGSYELQNEGSYTVYTNVNKKGFITDKTSSSAEKECLL